MTAQNIQDADGPGAPDRVSRENPYAADTVQSSSTTERPTHVRYGILALIVVMSILLYLDRLAFSPVASTVREELGLNKEQVGITTSWFFYSYALCMIPAGWMADRFGARKMLLIYVALWSVAVALMGFAAGLVTLAIGRFFLGVGQAGAYPAAAGLVKKWIPAASRGTANSMISMAGRGGGVLAMIITPLLMKSWGEISGESAGLWRAVFMLYGSLGLIWCVVYYFKFRDTPREHPGCNEAECNLIHGPSLAKLKRPAETGRGSTPADVSPFSDSFRFYRGVVSMLMMCCINILVNIGWIFLATWMPLYLKEVHSMSETSAGLCTSITGLTGMAGALTGGFLTDALARRFGLAWGRRIPGILAGTLGSLIYFGCLEATNVTVYICLFASISFVNDMGLAAIWSTYQDIGGKHVATLLGIANMCGNLAAAVFATRIGILADADQWQTVFQYSCISLGLVAVCWFFVNAGIPMMKEPPAPK